MTIKVTNNISFKRDNHGYVLTQTFETKKKDGSIGQGKTDYFYPKIDQVCGKILHLACDDSKVESELEDLRNAYYTVLAEMKMLLEGKL